MAVDDSRDGGGRAAPGAVAEYGGLPFQEQVDFLRRKINLPSEDWTQLWQEGHDHGFVVAGANKDALVADFHDAINRTAAEGRTLHDFRKDFDRIVAEHGWSYKGSRGWRSRVIYETNLRTSYAAGRYAQMKEVAATRPYWRYRHSDAVQTPRPEHLAWDGLVLAADDPWWQTHSPPNGWGCQCYVETLSERDLARLGKDGPDEAPPIEWETKTVGAQGAHPRTVRVPKGIDPGFAYAPGATAWTQPLAEQAMSAGAAYRAGDWERLITTTFADYARPERLPLGRAPVRLSQPLNNEQEVIAATARTIGGASKVYNVHGLPVAVDAGVLGKHVDPRRAEYLPLLNDLLTDPHEVWLSLERHVQTGYYQLRARIIKAYDLDQVRGLLLVAQQAGGYLESWTFVEPKRLSYLNNQRQGKLWWGKK